MQQQPKISATLEQTIRDALGPTAKAALAAVAAADDAMAKLSQVQGQLRALFPQLIADAAAAGRYWRNAAPAKKVKAKAAPKAAAGKPARKRVRSSEPITTWKADKRARRVPTYVIEATGLDTKRKIIDRYGDGATFHKGQPLPKPKLAAVPKAKKTAPAKKATPKKASAKKAPKAAAPPAIPANANGLAAGAGA